jgi:hypothetical protein
MQRIDGHYLYMVGSQIHPLSELRAKTSGTRGTTFSDAFLPLLVAESTLEPLLYRSVFHLRTSMKAGLDLLAAIRTLKEKVEKGPLEEELQFLDVYPVTTALTAFETVMGAEIGMLPLYIVTPVGGYDTAVLIEDGSVCFPKELREKVPDAVSDLQQGTKCIAFQLPTAAGFHLHRANETVLRRYWEVVTQNKTPPASRTIGAFLTEMDNLGVGDNKVKAALRDLKDLHRNPLIHPDESLKSTDEAVALMNGIHTVTVHMLREIPVQVPPSVGTLLGSGVSTTAALPPGPSGVPPFP